MVLVLAVSVRIVAALPEAKSGAVRMHTIWEIVGNDILYHASNKKLLFVYSNGEHAINVRFMIKYQAPLAIYPNILK